MCLELFIASTKPLPLIPWNDEAPAFHVVDLFDEARVLRNHLNQPFVYYAGSYQGCGCAFNYDAELAQPEEMKLSEQSLNSLVEYLQTAQSHGATIRIFSCWAGEENRSPESFRSLTPRQIREADFAFETPELLTIVNGA